MNYTIREIKETEYPYLEDFLYEAIFVPEGTDPPPRSILREPKLQASFAGFGTEVHDTALVAVADDQLVGAAWARIAEDYGHVDDRTPSLDLAVFKEYRGHGIGTELLRSLLALLKKKGYKQVSLSVQKANYAVKIYQRAGFKVLIDRPDEYIMVKDLTSAPDMTVPCGDGLINLRTGAIIMKDGRFLMVRNARSDYYYSVGGRIRFGETAEEAIKREVLEETGVAMEVDHLGVVQENYFIDDSPARLGKVIYEISFYFYMKVPEGFEPVCDSITEDDQEEYLVWISPDEPAMIFPAFFRTGLEPGDPSVKHLVNDDRFYIRTMTPADLEPLHKLLSDPEVMQYLEPPFSPAQTKHFLETQGLVQPPRILAVEDRDHCFIGYVIYHDYDDENKEIGWVLQKEAWGRGMAGLLTKQLIAMAGAEGKGTVIECVPEQSVTRRIAEKHGFTEIGETDGLVIYKRKQ